MFYLTKVYDTLMKGMKSQKGKLLLSQKISWKRLCQLFSFRRRFLKLGLLCVCQRVDEKMRLNYGSKDAFLVMYCKSK